MAKSEDDLRNFERNVVGFLDDDDRALKFYKELAPEHFRNPRLKEIFEGIRAGRASNSHREFTEQPLTGGPRMAEWVRQLIAAHPRRPTWSEPAAKAIEPECNGAAEPAAKVRRRPLSEDFRTGRRNTRKSELLILIKLLNEIRPHQGPKISKKSIADKFPGRDIDDPDEGVFRDEIGQAVSLTMDEMFAIEDKATAHPSRRGKRRFGFKTIICCGVAEAYLTSKRKQKSNERRTKKEKNVMSTTALERPAYPEMLAADAKLRKAQITALLPALVGDNKHTLTDLMMRVSNDPAWREIAQGNPDTYRRTMSLRLDEMETQRLIDSWHEPRPRGGKIRVVSLRRNAGTPE